jgi:hypothetical protein
MTQQTTLHLITYAPALVSKDGRTVDVIHGMEKALPGLRLKWRLSDSGRPIPLPQRDAWLLESIEDGEFPIVCNGDKSYPVTVSGMENPGLLSPGGQPLFEVHAKLPAGALLNVQNRGDTSNRPCWAEGEFLTARGSALGTGR